MIDTSSKTNLAICDLCGRRELFISYSAARNFLAAHEARAHRASYNARRAVIQASRRAARVS